MPKCPIEGCASPHDTWGGVATHVWKKQDESHAVAESKDEAIIWLADEGHIQTEGGSDVSPAEAVGSDGGSVEESSPTFPAAPDKGNDDGGNADAGSTQDADPVICPACNSEEIADAQAVVRNQSQHLNAEHLDLLRDSDYVCRECGGVFDDGN